ncbi:type 12 methyltransferase [Leptolyngbya sp. Heron Island J]|uniref:class I SAM-dependent methyltransferase n=1 Tax=Leptolyngbya sp. Heron Island J TaxID=1385935 RepID=UPI0003B9AC85|nr:class I SAM-dependent methyltransferase [Leptolyngbya sp. Heron Island J]ESA33019.1 type 12 methyltransferase [Leptolyngbya sp. Heron Island J]
MKKYSFAEIIENPFILDEIVSQDIHTSDNMNMSTRERYFEVGRSGISVISKALLCSEVQYIDNVLDFACGFGRVCRYLRAAFPDADFTVSDIWKEAVDYTSKSFKANHHHATSSFANTKFEHKFDLIWCGSLVTHIPEKSAIELLDTFANHLEKDGLMVFTTHGRNMYQRRKSKSMTYNISDDDFSQMENAYTDGKYAFATYEMKTVYGDDYGISMTPLGWIHNYLLDRDQLSLKAYIEKGWDNHQDVVAIAYSQI